MSRYRAHRIFGAPLVNRVLTGRERATLMAHERASYVIYIPPSGKVGDRVKNARPNPRPHDGGRGGVAR